MEAREQMTAQQSLGYANLGAKASTRETFDRFSVPGFPLFLLYKLLLPENDSGPAITAAQDMAAKEAPVPHQSDPKVAKRATKKKQEAVPEAPKRPSTPRRQAGKSCARKSDAISHG